MKIVSAFAGGFAGLMLFGVIVLVGTTLGLPSGPGWWVLGLPFTLLMAYLAAIAD